jgi:hypothetical protein
MNTASLALITHKFPSYLNIGLMVGLHSVNSTEDLYPARVSQQIDASQQLTVRLVVQRAGIR